MKHINANKQQFTDVLNRARHRLKSPSPNREIQGEIDLNTLQSELSQQARTFEKTRALQLSMDDLSSDSIIK